MPPELLASFIDSITPREMEGMPMRMARSTSWGVDELNEIEDGLTLGGGTGGDN